MAYAAVVSVAQILKHLLQQSDPKISNIHYPKPQIESLHGKICSLQSSLERIFPVRKSIRDEVKKLEIQVREAIYKAQDAVEFFVFRQSLISLSSSGSEEITSIFLQELQEVTTNIDPILEKAEEIAVSIKQDPQTGDLQLSEDAQPPSSKSGSTSKSTKIVGQEKDFQLLTDELLKATPELQVVSIVGMPGIGKTTLARSIYEDGRMEDHFGVRAWVTVSQEYNVGEIFFKLFGSLRSKGQKPEDKANQAGRDGQFSLHLYQSLFDTRYLVVIDDMRDGKVWDELKKYLPDNRNESRIILTTRIAKVAEHAKSNFCREMRPLEAENSWFLLCEKVFGGGPCPPLLDNTGRKIAENCGGLPLSLVVVGGQLSQERKTVEYWKIIEEDIHAAAADKGNESYLEILSLSYNHLPGRLKGCFLYMGAFPEDSEILVSKLIKLWVAEGFLTLPEKYSCLEKVAEQYLNDLVDRNLIFVRKISSNGQTKTCGIHDILRDLAERESREDKFFHSLKRYVPKLPDGTHSQRRLSVHKNILMCMEDVYQSTKSITLARTLLYAGRHHRHPLPFCLTFDLLRVLDAITVYFIEFPKELVKLIHLRYLSLTYNGKLPPSISELINLQILIVRRHPKLVIIGKSILPVEIWNMTQLRHLLFTESELPVLPENLAPNSVLLENLQSLSNVNATTCTEKVLKNMPNLKKLGIWIEAPGAVSFYLDQLQQLEAFKFAVLNAIPDERIHFTRELFFPKTLKKLSLSGCGIPWEEMTVIGQLPHLEVLKLREFAFQGPEWLPEEGQFCKLKFLLLESLDLEDWEADNSYFRSLQRLIIRHCYELKEIPSDIRYIGGLELIELVDCCPLAVESAKKLRDEKKDIQVRIYSSWDQ